MVFWVNLNTQMVKMPLQWPKIRVPALSLVFIYVLVLIFVCLFVYLFSIRLQSQTLLRDALKKLHKALNTQSLIGLFPVWSFVIVQDSTGSEGYFLHYKYSDIYNINLILTKLFTYIHKSFLCFISFSCFFNFFFLFFLYLSNK